MFFGKQRKKNKYLAELKNCRHAEDDLLSDAEKREFDALICQLQQDTGDVKAALARARQGFVKLPLARRYGAVRNFLDLLAVVGAVAFGIRGLFVQPFRIPTSSMQPTLYGIHYIQPEKTNYSLLKKLPAPLWKLLYAAIPAQACVSASGTLDTDSLAEKNGLLFNRTSFRIGGETYQLPGTRNQVISYAALEPERNYAEGDTLADGVMALGDHLFVERLSMYLSPPKRGDVIVFNTDNLQYNGEPLSVRSGYFYIKRLAGLPGDTLRFQNNQCYIRPSGSPEFQKIQDLAPVFAKLYSGKGGYQGHLSEAGDPMITGVDYTLPPDRYFMLGDNSSFSLDSRYFGSVERKNLVGRAWFVFYPLSRRLGPVDRAKPLDEPTGAPRYATFPVMSHQ